MAFVISDVNRGRISLYAATMWLLAATATGLFLVSGSLRLFDTQGADERIAIAGLGLALSIIFFIVLFWKNAGRDHFSFINMVLAFYFVMFVTPIFLLLYQPETAIKPFYWNVSSLESAVWVCVLGLFALCTGYMSMPKAGSKVVLPFGNEPVSNRIVNYVLLSFLISPLFILLRFIMTGSSIWEAMGYVSRDSQFTAREYKMGIFTLIYYVESFFSYLFYMCLILPKDKDTKKIYIYFAYAYIAYSVFNRLLISFISLKKLTALAELFIIAGYLNYTKSKFKARHMLVLFIGGSLALTFINYMRMRDSVDISRMSEIITVVIGKALMQSFEGFENLCATITHFPDSQNFYFGQRTFEETFYLIIPRFIWESKPLVYGFRAILYDINEQFFYSGQHPGLHAQFYADFGSAGIALGFWIFGVMIRYIHNVFRNNVSNKGVVLLYLTIVSYSWLYLWGGFPWLNYLIIFNLPFLIIFLYIYPRRKASLHAIPEGQP